MAAIDRPAVSPSGGYVDDIAYTAGFYPETAPGHAAFAALCRRRSPGLAWRPRRVLELGFGQGFGLSIPHAEHSAPSMSMPSSPSIPTSPSGGLFGRDRH